MNIASTLGKDVPRSEDLACLLDIRFTCVIECILQRLFNRDSLRVSSKRWNSNQGR